CQARSRPAEPPPQAAAAVRRTHGPTSTDICGRSRGPAASACRSLVHRPPESGVERVPPSPEPTMYTRPLEWGRHWFDSSDLTGYFGVWLDGHRQTGEPP